MNYHFFNYKQYYLHKFTSRQNSQTTNLKNSSLVLIIYMMKIIKDNS